MLTDFISAHRFRYYYIHNSIHSCKCSGAYAELKGIIEYLVTSSGTSRRLQPTERPHSLTRHLSMYEKTFFTLKKTKSMLYGQSLVGASLESF